MQECEQHSTTRNSSLSDLLLLIFTCIRCFLIPSREPRCLTCHPNKNKPTGDIFTFLCFWCAIKGRDGVAFRVLMWRVSNSRAATYPVPLVRASLHSLVINSKREWNYSISKPRERTKIFTELPGREFIRSRVAESRLLCFCANAEGEYAKPGPFNVKSCGNELNVIKSTTQALVWDPDMTCLHANRQAVPLFSCMQCCRLRAKLIGYPAVIPGIC